MNSGHLIVTRKMKHKSPGSGAGFSFNMNNNKLKINCSQLKIVMFPSGILHTLILPVDSDSKIKSVGDATAARE